MVFLRRFLVGSDRCERKRNCRDSYKCLTRRVILSLGILTELLMTFEMLLCRCYKYDCRTNTRCMLPLDVTAGNPRSSAHSSDMDALSQREV